MAIVTYPAPWRVKSNHDQFFWFFPDHLVEFIHRLDDLHIVRSGWLLFLGVPLNDVFHAIFKLWWFLNGNRAIECWWTVVERHRGSRCGWCHEGTRWSYNEGCDSKKWLHCCFVWSCLLFVVIGFCGFCFVRKEGSLWWARHWLDFRLVASHFGCFFPRHFDGTVSRWVPELKLANLITTYWRHFKREFSKLNLGSFHWLKSVRISIPTSNSRQLSIFWCSDISKVQLRLHRSRSCYRHMTQITNKNVNPVCISLVQNYIQSRIERWLLYRCMEAPHCVGAKNSVKKNEAAGQYCRYLRSFRWAVVLQDIPFTALEHHSQSMKNAKAGQKAARLLEGTCTSKLRWLFRWAVVLLTWWWCVCEGVAPLVS